MPQNETNPFQEQIPECYISLDEQGKILELNNKFAPLFSLEPNLAIGQIIWDFLPEFASHFYKPIKNAMKSGCCDVVNAQYPALQKWLEVNVVPNEEGVDLFIRDTSKTHLLAERNKLLDASIQNSADSIVITDKFGIILSFNRASEQLFGYSAAEILGKNVRLLMSGDDAKRHDAYLHRYLQTNISGILGVGPRDLVARDKNGNKVEIELAISEFRSSDSLYFVASMRDISERKALYQQLENLAGKDPLTSLPNRHLLNDRATLAVSFARRNNLKLAVMFIDLDGFKAINDNFGHIAGDYLIKTIADRISSITRESDTVARIGGDEFIVLLPSIEDEEDVRIMAKRILQATQNEVHFRRDSFSVSCSIGVARYPQHGDHFEQLLKKADDAMYRAKRAGKNTISIYAEK